MKLIKITISNILGIVEKTFDVRGQLTEISGDNATGKTSLLDAIRAAAGSGNMAHLIRKGAEKGETILEFDTGHVLTAKFGRKETERTIKTADGCRVIRTQDWLKSKLNPMSFNPVTFIQADAKRRVEMLLEVAPLSMEFSDLLNAVGEGWIPAGMDRGAGFNMEDPLSIIDNVHKAIFDNRTGLNRSIRDMDGQVAGLKNTLPEPNEEPVDPEGVEARLTAVRAEYKALTQAIETNYQNDRLAYQADTRREELEETKRHEEAIRKIAEQAQFRMQKALATRDEATKVLDAQWMPTVEELREKQGHVKARKAELDRAAQTQLLIEQVLDRRAKNNDESINNSIALDNLTKLRARLLENLPVPGLTIQNGILAYNDIPFDTLNDAGKTDVAMQLAAAGAGELKIICMDGLERLSKKSRQHFLKWAAATDAQFFYCLVKDDEPLTITPQDPPTAITISDDGP